MKRIFREVFWKVWWNMPWCILKRNKFSKMAKNKFDYDLNSDISIIAANCIGGELYSILGLPFLSPFINCSMGRNDFVKLAANFKQYMSGKLVDFSYNDRGEIACKLGGWGGNWSL